MQILVPKTERNVYMKNNYTVAERNRIVEEHLSRIDSTIRRNRALMRAARLDHDDVYQQLAIRLIRCVETFDPDKGDLEQHIDAQLQYEMLNCKAARTLTGVTHAPTDFRRDSIISLSAIHEDSPLYEQLVAA